MEELLNNIPKGENNAIHMTALAEKMGVTSATIKKLVQMARREGAEICSGNNGYWMAEDDQDKRKFITGMYKSSLSRFTTCQKIKRSLQEIPGQFDIFGGENGKEKKI